MITVRTLSLTHVIASHAFLTPNAEAVVCDAVSGSNWEGTGVVPDVACDAAEALDAALEVLRGG